MRNLIAHHHFAPDADLVFEVAAVHAPERLLRVRKLQRPSGPPIVAKKVGEQPLE